MAAAATITVYDCHATRNRIPQRPRSARALESARDVFTHGQCHSLALALHRETGWPIVGADWAADWDYGEYPGHVAVRTPSGNVLDIRGETAPEEDEDFYWDTDRVIPVEDVEGRFNGAYYHVREEIARPYARCLLRGRA